MGSNRVPRWRVTRHSDKNLILTTWDKRDASWIDQVESYRSGTLDLVQISKSFGQHNSNPNPSKTSGSEVCDEQSPFADFGPGLDLALT